MNLNDIQHRAQRAMARAFMATRGSDRIKRVVKELPEPPARAASITVMAASTAVMAASITVMAASTAVMAASTAV